MIVLIRGTGDIGSAVGHHLFTAGYTVLLHDGAQPNVTRRGMAFTDAVFDGRAELAGVTAVRVDMLATLPALVTARAEIPVVVTDLPALLRVVVPQVLVDARMRKRAQPERQRGMAPLTIGLGPNFVAGDTTDLAVETSWGDNLGAVLERGATKPLAGEPQPIAGHARDRYVYAPVAGVFTTEWHIGAQVRAGDTIAYVGTVPLMAPIAGALRGLTHHGVSVAVGTKVIEVDPRGPAAVVTGIGERPRRIADGVLQAVQSREIKAATA